ncbi:unnamed protein product [Rotaria sp. Silwood1]|nr:unnamed protein product [Rotaria sp. Silwood1]
MALVKDRPAIVDYFLQMKIIDVTKLICLTQSNQTWQIRLESLYQEVLEKDELHPLHKSKVKKEKTISDINEILTELIGDYMEPIYTVGDNNCFSVPMRTNQMEMTLSNQSQDQTSIDPVEQTIRDLFLWSVIMLRKDMCLVLIAHLSARICASLVASKVFKTCAQKYAYTIDMKTRLLEHANLFEKYAMKQLESCYYYDQVRACSLIIREIQLFGNVTCLQYDVK